jgi:formiminoglutamase
MDLKLFFSPVDEFLGTVKFPSDAFVKSISLFTGKMPAVRDADLAIIGVPESRGTETDPQVMENGIREIRKSLYQLTAGSSNYRIVDLGNLNPGHDYQQTLLRLKEVCEHLILNNVFPLIIGGGHDLDYGQFQAYESMEKMVSFLNVDAFLDMETENEFPPEKNHIQKILLHQPNYLFNYLHLAYQSYLVSQKSLQVLEKLYFETYRVGHLRYHLQEMEPVIRGADLLSFDLSAIKSADSPGTNSSLPFGLTGEEACQLCWYAGHSDKLSSAGFYGYNLEKDDENRKTAMVAATMIWYFIEGFYQRSIGGNYRQNDFIKYLVTLTGDPGSLVFYKSKSSEKWWMEIEIPGYRDPVKVPCSYNDYLMASNGEVPDRFIQVISRFS